MKNAHGSKKHDKCPFSVFVDLVAAAAAAAADTDHNNQDAGNNSSHNGNVKSGGAQCSPITPLIALTSIIWPKNNADGPIPAEPRHVG